MRVLLLGAGGMLGSAFVRRCSGHQLSTAGRADLDVKAFARVEALIANARPEVVINCAADTDVEAAERNPDTAFAVNAILPGLLGQACRRHGALLVHLSSTGAYGTAKKSPYTEEDPLTPTTVHHRSKASGEVAVRDSGCEHLILRTGWLFGGVPGAAKNFVWKRLVEARGAERMTSDASQRGNPTYVDDVTSQAETVIKAGLRGTYNVVSPPGATRAEYVAEIVAASGLSCRVEPSTVPFERAARVSPNETARNYRLELLGMDEMPDWRASLRRYVAELTGSPEWLALKASA